jgi:hypothetical protein
MAGAVRVVLKSVFDDKGLKQAQSELGSIGKGIGKTFAVASAAVAASAVVVGAFANRSLRAADDVAVANNRLGQIADSMGIFGAQTGAVTDRLIKFAEANELTVAVDAEVIKATQAKLLTFKNLAETADEVGGSMDRATLAALDLAAAGFGSAETNAVQLGKALQDPIKGITALARAGVTFTEQEKEKIRTLVESGKTLEAQDLILQAIETQVGGTAEATAKATDKMKLAFDNVFESVGAAMLPAFEELAVVVTDDLAPALGEVAEDLGPILVDVIKLIAAVLKDATDPSTNLGASVAKLGDSFDLLLSAMGGGESQIESTTDTLALFADVLDFVIVTLASFVAFIQSIGPAIEALQRGDFSTFWNWLNSDPITFMEGINEAKGGIRDFRKEMEAFNNTKFTGTGGTLQFLQDMGMGGVSQTPTTTTPTFTGGGGGGRNTAKEISKATKDASEAIKKAQKSYRDTVKAARKDYLNAVVKANADFAEASARALEARDKGLAELAKRNTEAVAQINKDFTGKLAGIVKDSIQRLRDAYRSAVAIDVGSLFDTESVGKSVDGLVNTLKDKLAASRRLLQNASALSARGFSQTFIEQVVGAGTETGNELAESILNATPETQTELQGLFRALEVESETGMDALSQKIYDGAGLATDALKQLYSDTLTEQTAALAEQAAAYAEQQAEVLAQFDETMKEAGATRDKALQDAMTAYNNALKEAAADFLAQLDEIEKKFKDKLKELGAQKSAIDKLQAEIDKAKKIVPTVVTNTPVIPTNQTGNNLGNKGGNTINVNVQTDSTQSTTQVGKVIAQAVSKYVNAGGQTTIAVGTGRIGL